MAIIADKTAWENFCNAKIDNGILTLPSIVYDCSKPEIPPKLITKLQATVCQNGANEHEISRQPFVISIIPSNIGDSFAGRMLKIGESDVIITKNIAIIAPTDNMLSTESKTIEENENS